jgi:hypothetical protein
MRNFNLIFGTYEMKLTTDQWETLSKLLASDNEDDTRIVDDFEVALNYRVIDWTLGSHPYLLLEIEPECEEDIPSILEDFERAFVETFGDFE